MSKILFLSLPYHGHTYPVLPLVHALSEQGEEILFFSHREFKPMVEAAGASFYDYDIYDLIPDPSKMTLIEVLQNLFDVTLSITEKCIDFAGKESPDLIIFDTTAHWGRITAGTLQIPAVSVFTSFCYNSKVATRSQLNELRRFDKLPDSIRSMIKLPSLLPKLYQLKKRYTYKLNSIEELANCKSDLNIVFTSRYMQPESSRFNSRYVFTGPLLGNRMEPLTPVLENFLNQKKQLVYISLGSIFHENLSFYRSCIKAFRDSMSNIIISCGNRIHPEDLGPTGPNFLILPFVPQLKVLKKASLFITHGGMNSTCESLYYGVPMIIIPQAIDQFIIANQIKKLRAGVVINKKKPSARQLTRAKEKVLNDPMYLKNTKRIQRSFIESGGINRAVQEILEYKARKSGIDTRRSRAKVLTGDGL